MKPICKLSGLTRLVVAALLVLTASAQVLAGSNAIFSIVTNPAADPSHNMRISWATDSNITDSWVEYAPEFAQQWQRANAQQSGICTTYDSVFSKLPNGQDFTEYPHFNKCGTELAGLKPDTRYKYRITTADGQHSDVYRFITAGKKEWSAAIISDFHHYTPLPKRLESAAAMLQTIDNAYRDVDWVMNIGDIIAWGGSYSFWKSMYEQPFFKRYMWAGLNGNHDDMARKYARTTNEFTRDANYYPTNGYEGEEGVCYWFKYNNVLFIMLNSEHMRKPEGLEAAQQWVRKVVKEQRTKEIDYTVVAEHYQWFYGTEGKTSQYERWADVFDELGIDLAIGANNHIYARTYPLHGGKVVSSAKGTTYVQTPSSDNERGQELYKPLTANQDKIAKRWNEGPQTVGAMHMSVTHKVMKLDLLDRNGNIIDHFEVSTHK